MKIALPKLITKDFATLTRRIISNFNLENILLLPIIFL
ncbi:hypothetical protein M2373_003608 [Chryseobacterium sp. JUb7]|nr:hypothetical protein [Chryseobacterium sp. JUb7]